MGLARLLLRGLRGCGLGAQPLRGDDCLPGQDAIQDGLHSRGSARCRAQALAQPMHPWGPRSAASTPPQPACSPSHPSWQG